MSENENKLFVAEEEEDVVLEGNAVQEVEIEDIRMIDEDDDEVNSDVCDLDPIVKEIPLNFGGKDENLHIFQYINKLRLVNHKPSEHPPISAARYKTKSALWEIDVPLDSKAFFNEDKAKENWNGVEVQTLKGVGVDNTSQYAAFMEDNQAYLVPVKTTTQLKPFFKYIDAVNLKKKQEESKLNATPASQRAQVVTMSVKSVNDASQNRLTGSLLAHKVADEEIQTDLNWAENTVSQFRESVIKESSESTVKPVESHEEYINHLI
ncbi:similar to Saccharomyces cerevisiae YKR025W RPC37 RNA polymerase III subunit C37 [Maudiozyma barnettii]|uniref:Similar to Saccharomyces cerevisiae YKR025W RPC37 RNA polymerase III subunit C37 n=1 Tax=Maudiozyma barnettii TaxID=61262 RepID=A0A8H2VFI3_9SACH|nr:DNA-directed RNA polymerase III subunit C37 [Kazachstania barnettii]CAB4254581.1 similar to Saccharomyces cerevisiae YKR025W RPC37 RNA polymerase III subunit C37 [Kazachstania barnettii]CAD1782623.1 similar to Saccharomyces cerevisiae YKR025W RPC37 RNA polymerase III subunit C37 [Kazachstania barnettii]